MTQHRTRRRGIRALAAAAALSLVGGLGASAQGTDLEVDEIDTSSNVELLTNVPKTGIFADNFNSDMAFQDDLAIVGNYAGFQIYDISTPSEPQVVSQVVCPGGQGDVSVSGDLLFMSVDSARSDDSCTSSPGSATNRNSWEGMRIFDISDKANPEYVKSVRTDCGSHTHTLIPGKNKNRVYLYVSSYGPSVDFPNCRPPHDSISIIDVPVNNPTRAKVVAKPDLFKADDGGYTNTSGCHDITAYPSKNIAAGACMGDGIMLDIKNPVKPKVIERVRDTENFAFWHSATFNEKANKVVFTDELGGGGGATCNDAIGPNRGANAIYQLKKKGDLRFVDYYKIERDQGDTENCVAHNGSLIPVKGKDIMVQAWYQGGVSIWDFTNSRRAQEIGYFERGPIDDEQLVLGGSWSAYYYNGYVYSSDITKGLDVIAITDPRVRRAESVQMDELNVQTQPKYLGNKR